MFFIFLLRIVFMFLFSVVYAQKEYRPEKIVAVLMDDVSTLDPHAVYDKTSDLVVAQVHAGLVKIDEKGRLAPDLAESWFVSPNGLTYTFRLRKNIRFSDGTPITAHDVCFSFQRLADPKTMAPAGMLVLSDVVNGSAILSGKAKPFSLGVRAVQDTVVFHLISPDFDFVNKLAASYCAVVKKDSSPEKLQGGWGNVDLAVSGAYKFSKPREYGQCLYLKKNHFYHGHTGNIEQLSFRVLNDPQIMLQMFLRDEAHFCSDISFEQVATLEKKFSKQKLITYPTLNAEYLLLNPNIPAFRSKDVRKAMSLAIDRNVLANKLLKGRALPLDRMLPYGFDGDHSHAVSLILNNRSMAEDLLKKSGYGLQKPFSFTHFYNVSPANKSITSYLVRVLKDFGIIMNLEYREWKVFLQERGLKKYGSCRDGRISHTGVPSAILDNYRCNSNTNDSYFCNPSYDKLLDDVKKENKPDARLQIYQKASRILQDEYLVIPLLQPMQHLLIAEGLKNVLPNSVGSFYFCKMSYSPPSLKVATKKD